MWVPPGYPRVNSLGVGMGPLFAPLGILCLLLGLSQWGVSTCHMDDFQVAEVLRTVYGTVPKNLGQPIMIHVP